MWVYFWQLHFVPLIWMPIIYEYHTVALWYLLESDSISLLILLIFKNVLNTLFNLILRTYSGVVGIVITILQIKTRKQRTCIFKWKSQIWTLTVWLQNSYFHSLCSLVSSHTNNMILELLWTLKTKGQWRAKVFNYTCANMCVYTDTCKFRKGTYVIIEKIEMSSLTSIHLT